MGMPGACNTGEASLLKGAVMTSPSEDYRLIPLTQGQFAIVDAADYDWAMQYKWCAQWSKFTKSFYAGRNKPMADGRYYFIRMNRELLGLEKGDKRQSEHENRNTLDNRRGNLRIATRYENMHNRTMQADNTSGFKGVSFHKHTRKWMAYIGVNGKRLHLGLRDTAENAYLELYVPAAERYHGEFARTK